MRGEVALAVMCGAKELLHLGSGTERALRTRIVLRRQCDIAIVKDRCRKSGVLNGNP